MLLPFVILIAVFYFLLIRPENKKKKAAAKMRSELAVGDEITTIGGVVGTICQVKEDTIIIEACPPGRRPLPPSKPAAWSSGSAGSRP